MVYNILIFIFITYAAFFSTNVKANQEVTIECSSCFNQQDFENSVTSYMSTASSGQWLVNVINPSLDAKIWHVNIDVTSESSSFGNGTVYIINSTRGSSKVEKDFSALVRMMKKPIDVDIDSIPSNDSILSECNTASYKACPLLSTYLRGLPESQAFFVSSVASTLYRKLFGGKKLRYLVHYPDGTSIILESKIEGAITPALAFSAIEKSIINSDGSVNNGYFYSEVPTGGHNYSIQSSGGRRCEVWMWVTRVNGEVSSITFSCI